MIKRFFQGIRGQLLLNYLIVILISIGSLSFIVQQIPFRDINGITSLINQRYAFRLAPLFVDHYERIGSWDEAQVLVNQYNQSMPEHLSFEMYFPGSSFKNRDKELLKCRIVVANEENLVVADSNELFELGQPLPEEMRMQAITLENKTGMIGKLIYIEGGTAEFIELIRNAFMRTIAGGGLLAAVVAFLASIFLTRQIAEPVRRLSTAARHLSSEEEVPPLIVSGSGEISEMTQAFNDMVATVENQKHIRKQMMADIAHELRTPLSIIQLNVEALEDGFQPPQETATSLRVEISALSRLIDDLRLLSLADTGGLHLEPEMIAPGSFLEQLIQSWQVKAQERQIQLLSALNENIPFVKADRGRLTQAMNNLISNALHYTPAGDSVIIDAKCSGEEVVFSVSDNGPGISAQALPHVFERFYRADPSRNRETGGSGLGLAIARRLVILQGGRIWVESTPERITTFYIALPRV